VSASFQGCNIDLGKMEHRFDRMRVGTFEASALAFASLGVGKRLLDMAFALASALVGHKRLLDMAFALASA